MTFPYEPGKIPNEPGAIPSEQRILGGEPSQLASAGDLRGGTDRASAIELGGVDPQAEPSPMTWVSPTLAPAI